MKGSYGYIASVLTLIVGLLTTLRLAGQFESVNNSLGTFLIAVMFGSGFIGGFIAPYHVKKNTIRSMLTVIGIGGLLVGIIYLFFNELISGQGSGDPLGDLVIGVILIVIMVVIGLIFVGGTIATGIGGVAGSIFGKMFFKPESFEDLVEVLPGLWKPIP